MLFEAPQGGVERLVCSASYVWQAMYYVYLILSEGKPSQTYVGMTSDLKKRIASHNSGANKHTSKFKPWELVCYLAFEQEERAVAFEKYHKAGSGHAFAQRHLW